MACGQTLVAPDFTLLQHLPDGRCVMKLCYACVAFDDVVGPADNPGVVDV